MKKNVVTSCTEARRRELTGTLLYSIGSESSCDLAFWARGGDVMCFLSDKSMDCRTHT
jgi:hypothetical protein